MGAQRKRYLQLADAAAAPRDRLFYKLMADLAPAVNDMARAQVNQVGSKVVYDVVIRSCAAIAHELTANLTDAVFDPQEVVTSFREAMGQMEDKMRNPPRRARDTETRLLKGSA